MKHVEIESLEALDRLAVEGHRELSGYAFQNIDFSVGGGLWSEVHFSDCLFLGCRLPAKLQDRVEKENLVYPMLEVPFNPFISHLYDAQSLYDAYEPGHPESMQQTFDARVYQHFVDEGKMQNSAMGIKESMARALHDHSMNDALHDFLGQFDERQVIGVMGGHGIERTAESYRKVVLVSKQLTEAGRLMVSGGGPGAMEATHLGAWLAGRSMDVVDDALAMVSVAPSFRDAGWLDSALAVMRKYPQESGFESLGIPTWLYGHEPATPFATRIAKYFDNSIREDCILSIAKGGIVYTPGSAGTVQEIFQDATQNHYETFGYASPMVFVGTEFWTREMPIYPLLTAMMQSGRYKNLLLALTDEVDEVVKAMTAFNS